MGVVLATALAPTGTALTEARTSSDPHPPLEKGDPLEPIDRRWAVPGHLQYVPLPPHSVSDRGCLRSPGRQWMHPSLPPGLFWDTRMHMIIWLQKLF